MVKAVKPPKLATVTVEDNTNTKKPKATEIAFEEIGFPTLPSVTRKTLSISD